MLRVSLAALLVVLVVATEVSGQSRKLKSQPTKVEAAVELPQLLGIRPGLLLDSVMQACARNQAVLREVPQDTLTNCFADNSIRIFVLDSIFCKLTYMRMTFLFDNTTNRLRRFTITPRETSIAQARTDGVLEALLLYFGNGWGTPEIALAPPAHFRWRVGNIEVRGYIKREYPLWVMEG